MSGAKSPMTSPPKSTALRNADLSSIFLSYVFYHNRQEPQILHFIGLFCQEVYGEP